MAKRNTYKQDGYIYTVPVVQTAEQIDVSACTKVKHPNLFIDMRSAYSYMQFIALFRIVESLQPVISSNFQHDGENLTIQSNNVYWNKDAHAIEVTLPLRHFGVRHEHYDDLENALLDMSRISVTFPQWSQLSQKELATTGGLCRVAIDRANKRHHRAHFFFNEQIIRNIVNPYSGFSQILKETVEKVHSVYTAKLYFIICRWADKGKWTVSYKELRDILNVDSDKYPDYKDFRKRILKNSADELQNSTNYWFTFHERFPAKSKKPDVIYFTIYNSAPDQQEIRDYKNRVEKIKAMCRHMNVSVYATGQLIGRITPKNSRYVYDKVSELVAYITTNREEILDPAAYYRQSLQNIIYNDLFQVNDQPELDFTNPSNS